MAAHSDAKSQTDADSAHSELIKFKEFQLNVHMMEPKGVCQGVLAYVDCNSLTANYQSSKICTYRCDVKTYPVEWPMRLNWCTRLLGFRGTYTAAPSSANLCVYLHMKIMHKTIPDLYLHPAVLHCIVESIAAPHIKTAGIEAAKQHFPSLNLDPSAVFVRMSTDAAFVTQPYSGKTSH